MNTHPIEELLARYFEEAHLKSNIIIIRGEFGIGKTFHINKFLENKHIESNNIIHIEAHPFDTSNYSTLNQAIYKYISNMNVKREVGKKLLQKASTLIPRFGQFISDVLEPNLYSDTFNQLVKRAGINTEIPNLLGLINFFEKQSVHIPFVFYCKNIQWFDRKSWEILLQLLMLVTEKKWFCLLSYTTNAELPVLSHEEINSTICQLKTLNEQPLFHVIEIERWKRGNIPTLCNSILQNKVTFSRKQYDCIFQYTEGVPLYVKTILSEFIQHGYMVFEKDHWISKLSWNSEKIRDILKDSVKEKVSRVYKEIPESRDILELGSIIQDEFTDTSISEIFQLDNPFNILLQVERRFRIIQYILDSRLWKFEHYIVQDYIYRSLGDRAKILHLEVARYLEKNSNNNKFYLKIAHNFRLGGDMDNAAKFHLKEIKSLLDSGCYSSAALALEDFGEQYEYILFSDEEKEREYEFLKARSMFYNVQYQLAKESFTFLAEATEKEDFKTECYRWLARTLLKLESQKDFNEALEYLQKAKKYYEKTEDYSKLGDILLDFIVAYAHLNNKNKARELYHQAEIYFNRAKDKIGMLRLQRKSIIFMEAKLSAPILVQTARKWEMLNVPQERIMCLNNAAVQYIYLQNYDEAKKILKEAIEESLLTDNFGQVYLNNNMGLVHIFKGNKTLVKKNFQEAKKGKFRFVEQLVVDINLSAYYFSEKGGFTVASTLRDLYTKALTSGENAYIIPATLNWALANIEMGEANKSIELLESIQEAIQEYNAYELAIWYNALYSLYNVHNQSKKQQLQLRYEKTVNYYTRSHPDYPRLAYVTMEYWSDN